NFGNGFRQVFMALEHLQASDHTIDLDFSNCSFTNPALLLPLVALKESSIFSHRLNIDTERFSASTSSYLNTVYFPSCFKADQMDACDLSVVLNGYKYKSYIPIISF